MLSLLNMFFWATLPSTHQEGEEWKKYVDKRILPLEDDLSFSDLFLVAVVLKVQKAESLLL